MIQQKPPKRSALRLPSFDQTSKSRIRLEDSFNMWLLLGFCLCIAGISILVLCWAWSVRLNQQAELLRNYSVERLNRGQ